MSLLPPLEQNEPITEVIVINHNSNIDVYAASLLLPTPFIPTISANFRGTGKRGKPPTLMPGTVVSINHLGIQRGLLLNTKPTSFRYTTSADISVPYVNTKGEIDNSREGKNVNVKISRQSFQISGPKHYRQAIMAAEYLFDYFIRIHSVLEYMARNKEITDITFNWVLSNAFLSPSSNIAAREGDRKSLSLPTIPDFIDPSIISLIYHQLPHFESLSFLAQYLDKIREFKFLITNVDQDDWETVKLNKNLNESYFIKIHGSDAYLREVMVKRDHLIDNFKFTPQQVVRHFLSYSPLEENRNPFMVIFDPAIESSVEIIVPVGKYSNLDRGTLIRQIRFFLFKLHFSKGGLRMKHVGPGNIHAVEVYNKLRDHLAKMGG
jgi:hypothetical protein